MLKLIIPLCVVGGLFSCAAEQNEAEKQDPYKRGKFLYEANCITCHQADGNGTKGFYPPLKASDYLLKNRYNGLSAVKNGLEGEITVNGKLYDAFMPPVNLSEGDIVDVINFVRNSWGNKADSVSVIDIRN